MTVRIRPTSKHAEFNQNNTTWPAKANQIDAKKMNVSAASLAPDSSVRKATPSDITERTARSGAVVETMFLSRPRRAQCSSICFDDGKVKVTIGRYIPGGWPAGGMARNVAGSTARLAALLEIGAQLYTDACHRGSRFKPTTTPHHTPGVRPT